MSSPNRALVVVDVQKDYFDGPLEIQYPPRAESLANVVQAIEHATAGDVPVVVVQHEYPQDAPVFAAGSAGYAVHEDVEAVLKPDVKRVQKNYASVFADTDLADWLTSKGIDTVTLAGYMTNNCDLASAAHAEALGLTVEVLSDATGAVSLANEAGHVSGEELHTTLMVLLQSNFAAVATTAEWTAAVASRKALPKSNLVASALAGRSASATTV